MVNGRTVFSSIYHLPFTIYHPSMNDQILREFLAETEDLLEILFGDLQALRVRRAEGRARRELVGRIFRHVHTIKGSSATVELNSMTKIAHEFETLLDGVRLGRIAIDETVLDAFDDAAHLLSQSLERVARGESQPQAQALLERLRGLARQEADDKRSPAVRRTLAALPEEIARSLSEHEAHRLLNESRARGFGRAHLRLRSGHTHGTRKRESRREREGRGRAGYCAIRK